jgi:hypothetical protein
VSPTPNPFDAVLDALAQLQRQVAAIQAKLDALTPSAPSAPAQGLQRPMFGVEIDRMYHLRKGSAKRAAKAGYLKGIMRRGRGGPQLVVMPADVQRWLDAGMKIPRW